MGGIGGRGEGWREEGWVCVLLSLLGGPGQNVLFKRNSTTPSGVNPSTRLALLSQAMSLI